VALAVVALPVAGCGAGAPAAKGADAPPPDPEADIAELDRGEWRITELFGPPGGAPPPDASAAPAASAAPVAQGGGQPLGQPTPQDAAMEAKPGAPQKGGESAPAQDPCGIACNALASMGRAARHLCEMAGPDEPRCTSARERVKNATERVSAHCACNNN
jgi:hypothetical protein